jgi:tetratricopeptide (TPR) repeat protein
MHKLNTLIVPLVLGLMLGGCAALRPAAPLSDSPAVLGLIEQARAESADGRLTSAAASLERALRLEPRNPFLWQELARLRLAQGDYDQAEQLAARANSWAGTDRRLRAANWRLIGEARSARGDAAGAQAAAARAAELER